MSTEAWLAVFIFAMFGLWVIGDVVVRFVSWLVAPLAELRDMDEWYD